MMVILICFFGNISQLSSFATFSTKLAINNTHICMQQPYVTSKLVLPQLTALPEKSQENGAVMLIKIPPETFHSIPTLCTCKDKYLKEISMEPTKTQVQKVQIVMFIWCSYMYLLLHAQCYLSVYEVCRLLLYACILSSTADNISCVSDAVYTFNCSFDILSVACYAWLHVVCFILNAVQFRMPCAHGHCCFIFVYCVLVNVLYPLDTAVFVCCALPHALCLQTLPLYVACQHHHQCYTSYVHAIIPPCTLTAWAALFSLVTWQQYRG